jgi:membrane-bound lytic murein transglycosylase D
MSTRDTDVTMRADWRWALTGCFCVTLGTSLLLASCAIDNSKKTAPPITQTNPPEADVEPAKAVTQPIPNTAADAPNTQIDPNQESVWLRLNRRFAMPGCDYQNDVLRWAHVFTQNPSGFQTSLAQAMPFLLIVLDQLERRELPGEFAMLPYVESTYTPLQSHGDRPGGMWQIVPNTARDFGIRITADYDGRLDMYASTTAALDMIKQYQQEFGDWRLANMAFNAGENRVKQLVKGSGAELSSTQLRQIKFDQETHEHLTKLLALSCVISSP